MNVVRGRRDTCHHLGEPCFYQEQIKHVERALEGCILFKWTQRNFVDECSSGPFHEKKHSLGHIKCLLLELICILSLNWSLWAFVQV